MSTYTILLSTPFSVWDLHPEEMGGLPIEPPVLMNDVIAAICRCAPSLASVGTQLQPSNNAAQEASLLELIGTAPQGPQILRESCVIQVRPTAPQQFVTEPAVATLLTLGHPVAIHGDLLLQVATKLRVAQHELREAITAMEMVYATGQLDAKGYLELPSPVIESILTVGRSFPLAMSSCEKQFHVHNVLAPELRSALQTIVHELTPADGLGHAHKDSTTQGLIREFAGADAGDKHEAMVAETLPHLAEHPELCKRSTPEE